MVVSNLIQDYTDLVLYNTDFEKVFPCTVPTTYYLFFSSIGEEKNASKQPRKIIPKGDVCSENTIHKQAKSL